MERNGTTMGKKKEQKLKEKEQQSKESEQKKDQELMEMEQRLKEKEQEAKRIMDLERVNSEQKTKENTVLDSWQHPTVLVVKELMLG